MANNEKDYPAERNDPSTTEETDEQHAETMTRSVTDRTPSADDSHSRPHAGTMWVDLTGFQRDLLTCIRRLDEETTIPTGTTIKESMESLYGETINHGRLYQNLNHLAEEGCIDKVVVDGRTNAYYLTEGAIEMFDETVMQLVSTCGLQQSITES